MPAPPDEKGIKIIAATCGNNRYTKQQIYDSLEISKEYVQLLQERGELQNLIYYPEPYEVIPFQKPYYFHYIEPGSPKNHHYDQLDMIIFTGRGQLAKVKSLVQIFEGIRQRESQLEDCLLDYELIPDPRPEWKLK